MMNNFGLKPCPICGYDDSVHISVIDNWSNYRVSCEDLDHACIRTAKYEDPFMAVAAWNLRACDDDNNGNPHLAEVF